VLPPAKLAITGARPARMHPPLLPRLATNPPPPLGLGIAPGAEPEPVPAGRAAHCSSSQTMPKLPGRLSPFKICSEACVHDRLTPCTPAVDG
jgi:hypothetical protein